MRSPQFGRKRRQRSDNTAVPADAPVLGHIMPYSFAHGRKTAFELPKTHSEHKPVLANGHAPVALYGPTLRRVRYVSKRDTKIALHLWHKRKLGKKHLAKYGNPIITKKRPEI